MTPDELRQYRKSKKMTQESFAEWLKVSKRSVIAWENKQNPIPVWVEEKIRNEQVLINPKVTYDVFRKFEIKAQSLGITVSEYVAKLMENVVNETEPTPQVIEQRAKGK